MLDGGALPDLRSLIETRIPEHRSSLETGCANLHNVANYCENNYINARDRGMALDETKQFALQSLASVAYQINTLARDLLDMLDLQTEKIDQLAGQVDHVGMVVSIHKEKLARREIGVLTANKSVPKQLKVVAAEHKEERFPYKRTPIDYSVLDGVGHGTRVADTQSIRGGPAGVSRAPSTVSGGQSHYGHYQQYDARTATLGRSSMRSGMSSMGGGEHYRVPSAMPTIERMHSSGGGGGGGGRQRETGIDYAGSHHSSDYGYNDRYGTLRGAPAGMQMNGGEGGGGYGWYGAVGGGQPPREHSSPTLPLPPPQLNSNYNTHYSQLPPPPSALLSSTHDEDMPLPPPMGLNGGGGGEGVPDWVPANYLDKCVALYDYDADKVDELSLREGAVVWVVRKNDDGWFEGVMDGVTGLFPGNYVQPM